MQRSFSENGDVSYKILSIMEHNKYIATQSDKNLTLLKSVLKVLKSEPKLPMSRNNLEKALDGKFENATSLSNVLTQLGKKGKIKKVDGKTWNIIDLVEPNIEV
jgi:hypothetical protein